MRPTPGTIPAPSFPADLAWIGVSALRMEQQARRPVLVEFWDFCRPASLRTLPYVREWHRRYAEAGLRVVSAHAPGFAPGQDEDEVRAAVARLGIEHPVVLDTEFLLWRRYENPGWPARYLFAPGLRLFEFRHGEGGYHETELAIQELLEIEREPVALLRPQDDDDVALVVPSADVEGPLDGPYAAGAVWVVAGGPGTLLVDGEPRELAHAGAHLVAEHPVHAEAEIALQPLGGLVIHATTFEAGLAP